MVTKICPECGEEKDARGFAIHVIRCRENKLMEGLRKRYANQLAKMSPEAGERFLRKARNLQGG